MAVQQDFTITRYDNATLVVQMAPPTPIGGWELLFEVAKRFGGGGVLGSSGLIVKRAASGYGNGVSGITVTDSGAGIFQVQINSVDTSGMDFGNYAQSYSRVQSGARLTLGKGYLKITPSADG